MRRVLVFGFVTLAVLAIAAALLLRERTDDATAPGAAERPEVARDASPAQSPPELEYSVETSAKRALESRLLGVVVDANGTALPNARLWIAAPGDEWALGIVPPAIDALGKTVRAFETHTAADGRFELRTPAPTAERLRLDVVSADGRGAAAREFESGAHATASSIAPGDNDLGRIALVIQASIRGQVRTRDGAPLAGANVTRRLVSTAREFGRTRTDREGRYWLANVPAGVYELRIEAAGHLPHFEPRVVVPDGADLTGIDFALPPVPTLSGRVVDELGAPAANVQVGAAPAVESRDIRPDSATLTADDGTFVIPLKSEERHVLWTEDGAYSAWKSWRTSVPDYAPGARGIEIRVERLGRCHLHAADALTGAPITAFGFYTLGEDDVDPLTASFRELVRSRFPNDVPEARNCPERGFAVTLLSPPQRVLAWAPGYAPLVQTLLATDEQTLKLAPLGGLTGSFVRNGIRCAAASIVVRPLGDIERWNTPEFAEPSPSAAFVPEPVFNVRQPARRVQARADGTFRVVPLQPGEYELYVMEDGRRWQDPIPGTIVVRPGADTALGAIALASARATLRTKFVFAEGTPRDLASRHVQATLNGQWITLTHGVPDEYGVYVNEDLPAGRLFAVFADDAPLLGEPRTWEVELEAGKTRELTIDLSDVAACELHARGAPDSPRLRTRRVFLRTVDGPEALLVDLGVLDEDRERLRQGVYARAGTRVVLEARDLHGDVLTTSGTIEVPRAREFEVLLSLP